MNREDYEIFVDFFKRYYHDAIMDLAGEYPDRKTLIVDFNYLQNFNPEAGDRLLQNPDTELKKPTEALRNYDLPIDYDLPGQVMSKAVVSVKNLPDTEKVPIFKIGSSQVNKLIKVEGRINKVGPVWSKLRDGAFKCQRCGHINHLMQESDKYTEPFECQNDDCGRKGPFRLDYQDSAFVDEQKLELQDLYENLNPGQPLREILVYVRDRYLIESVPAIGAQVIVSGIVRSQQKTTAAGKTSLFTLVLDAIYIEAVEPDINLSLTNFDKNELRELVANQNIFDKLIQSTAPTVLGYPEIKLALLAAAVSGPNFALPDGRQLRGYIHLAICGDPGTAKTVMVDSLRSLVLRSQYAAGKGASVVGLTVAAVKDDLGGGGYVAQAGALVLADKGLMVIDEVDKFKPEDQQALNTVLESGRIPVNKGRLNQTFNARCPIIAISNPKEIRFDKNDADLARQIDIPIDTLSRFDLVFKIQDIPEPEKDRKIAEHQLRIWQKVGREQDFKHTISMETMRKYLAYAKTFDPAITENISKAIIEYYLELRKSGGGNGAIPATARNTDGLSRLTKSIAKLRLSDICSIEDVELAIAIHKVSIEAVKDPTTGLPDIDILYGMSMSQRDRIRTVRKIIQELQKSDGDAAFFEDIVSSAKVKGITKDQTEDILKHLKKQGEIIEVKDGFYRVMPA